MSDYLKICQEIELPVSCPNYFTLCYWNSWWGRFFKRKNRKWVGNDWSNLKITVHRAASSMQQQSLPLLYFLVYPNHGESKLKTHFKQHKYFTWALLICLWMWQGELRIMIVHCKTWLYYSCSKGSSESNESIKKIWINVKKGIKIAMTHLFATIWNLSCCAQMWWPEPFFPFL